MPTSSGGLIGDIISALGEGIQVHPHPAVRAAGKIYGMVGDGVSATGEAFEAGNGSWAYEAARISAGFLGSTAATALLIGYVSSTPATAILVGALFATSPVLAILGVAGAAWAAGWFGNQAGEIAFDLGYAAYNFLANLDVPTGLADLLAYAQHLSTDFQSLLGGIASNLAQFMGDPLVLDLDGDGVEVTPLDGSAVFFDYANDGFAERTGWVSEDDGILAIDHNNNNTVDGIGELFGSPTQDGFAVLETLDTNGDGKIDAQDADFGKLRIWRDLNQNGTTESGELQTLAEIGIDSIDLIRTDISGTNAGHEIGFQANFNWASGAVGTAQTIYFQTDRQDTRADHTPEFTPAEGVEDLPFLPGTGAINSIAYKLTMDEDFRADWTSLTDNAWSMSHAHLRAEFEELLQEWAGITEVNPLGRGSYVDGRHLAFVEAFFGDTYREIQFGQEARTFPGSSRTGGVIEDTYQQLVTVLETIFLTQVTRSVLVRGGNAEGEIESPYFSYTAINFDPVQGEDELPLGTPGNLGLAVELLIASLPSEQGDAAAFLIRGLIGLEGLVTIIYSGNRQAYADAIEPSLAPITDTVLYRIAEGISDGSALIGSELVEGLRGTSSDDVLVGGGGGDVIDAGAGSDIVVYNKSDGDLWIKDSAASLTDVDRLVLTDIDSSDVTFERVGDTLLIKVTETGKTVYVEQFFRQWGVENRGVDVIRFSDGTEWNRSQISAETVFQGDSGNNLIADSDQDDVIYGSTGHDQIQIGEGSDTILYGRGDGCDVITDEGNDLLTENDTLVLTNLNPADVELTRTGEHLLIKIKDTGETIECRSFFAHDESMAAWASYARGIDSIRFADGTTWDRPQIQKEAYVRGYDYYIQLSGLNETITGREGDDYLLGSAGNNTFLWKKGDGNDRIHDDISSDVDTLVLKDVRSSEVRLSYQGDTLLITILATNEVIQIDSFFLDADNLSTDWNLSHRGIDNITFSDGVTWGRQQIFHQTGAQYLGRDFELTGFGLNGSYEWLYFTDEFGNQGNIVGSQVYGPHDNYAGYNGDNLYSYILDARLSPGFAHNSLDGNGGNDVLIGGDGHDILDGGQGNDRLYGDDFNGGSAQGGHDSLFGGDGNDELYGGAGLDQLDGGAGSDYLSGGDGKDFLYGRYGDDILVGGKGDDHLEGGYNFSSGADTYIYTKGDGNDVIYDETIDTNTDKLRLTDLNADDVELSRSGDDLLITIHETGEVIRIIDQFDLAATASGPSLGIELIVFANGEEWDRARLQSEAWYRGTNLRDYIFTERLNDTIEGGKGDDVITSGYNFASGADTFVYSKGDGNDVIYDETIDTNTDKLRLTDLNADNVELSRSGDDLLITVRETGEVIRIIDQFDLVATVNGPSLGIELIVFANGEEWDRARLQSEAWYRGTDLRDYIFTERLNDTIEGGKGDDVITSGYNFASGADTFVYSKGDGNDVIYDETGGDSNLDRLELKDLNADEITLLRAGSDLLIRITATDETIRIVGQFQSLSPSAPGAGLEVIRFANGQEWSRETIRVMATTSAVFFAGTSGNDVIEGSALSQNLFGERGDDTIDGKAGSDLLYGGIGNDKLIVSESSTGDVDTLNGGVGNDTADFSAFGAAVAVDLVVTGAEARTKGQPDLISGAWRDIAEIEQVENVTGTAFADQISGDASDNILTAGGGDDTLDGRSGNDTLVGGSGSDALTGGMGNDTLLGDDGADTLSGGLDQDTLVGASGNDTLTGGTESDIFVLGPNFGMDVITDFIAGAGGEDVIKFDRSVFNSFAAVQAAASQVGSDVVIDAGSGNTVTLANVQLSDLHADDFVFARLDNRAPTQILKDGGEISENVLPGEVVATLSTLDPNVSDTHNYTIVGGSDLFEIIGNEIRVKAGASLNYETAKTHTLLIRSTDDEGTSVTSNVVISVTDVQEAVTGSSGSDTLSGDIGRDAITGGQGNDLLKGFAGSDSYHYTSGDGDDRIVDDGPGSDIDRLILGNNILPANVVVGRSSLNSNDVVLRLADGAVMVLADQLSPAAGAGIEEILFDNGTVWNRTDILSHLEPGLILGTSASDTLSGANGAEIFDAGTGDDTLSGHAGNDIYRVGFSLGADSIVEGNDEGTDRIELVGLNVDDVEFSKSGSNLLIRNLGTGEAITIVDQFTWTRAGVEEIVFDNGTVWNRTQILNSGVLRGTAGNDTLNGTPDDDVFNGDQGDDLIKGSGGSDITFYSSGDGNDTLEDGAARGEDTDTLWLQDLNASDLTFSRQSANLSIKINSTGETLLVKDQFRSPTEFWGIEQIKFADGSAWNTAQIRDAAWIRGTSVAETVSGTSDADTIDGGAGSDTLQGGAGGDTYIFKVGSGNDTIAENSAPAATDRVKLIGLNVSDVALTRNGSDLFVTINASNEVLKVYQQFTSAATGIEELEFGDGTIWTAQDIQDYFLAGSPGNDTLIGFVIADRLDGGAGSDRLEGRGGGDTFVFGLGYGADVVDADFGNVSYDQPDTVEFGAGITPSVLTLARSGNNLIITVTGTSNQLTIEDQFESSGRSRVENFVFANGTSWTWQDVALSLIQGTSGDDTLIGYVGADVLDGGAGNDLLKGRQGDDTYKFGRDYGADTVDDDFNGAEAGPDRVLFGSNILVSNLEFSQVGDDLVIRIVGTADSLTVKKHFISTYQISSFEFADQTVLTAANVQQIIDATSPGTPTHVGTAGADTINGTSGADIIDGLGGDDILRGANGADIYLYGAGSGNDRIEEASGTNGEDTLRLMALNPSDVELRRFGNDLVVRVLSSSETVTVKDHFVGTSEGIEKIKFTDGTVWDRTVIQATAVRVYLGTSDAETISGSSGNDILDGLGGVDTLSGGGGSDTYLHRAGSGNDIINDSGSSSDVNTLRLIGVNPSDVTLLHSGSWDLLVQRADTGETIKVNYQFLDAGYGIDKIVFDDGSFWEGAYISANVVFLGTSGAETINGTSGNDTLDGLGGADTLYGGNGSDTYLYRLGSGNDTINETADANGVDKLKLVGLNSSDVTITRTGYHLFITITSSGEQVKITDQFSSTTHGVEQIIFQDNTVLDRAALFLQFPILGTSGNDSLSGSSGDDAFRGGLGNDTIYSAAGSDIYIYASGDGNDKIDEESGSNTEIDTLWFTDINASDITLTKSGNDVMVNILATGHQIEFDEQYWSATASWGVDQIRFGDGTSWNRDTMMQNAWWNGTAGNDTMTGWASFDNIDGGLGADTLNGGAGVDKLIGGGGNDTLTSGAGNDTIIFRTGFGNDTITDFTAGAASDDVIEFHDGIFADFAAVQAASQQVGSNVVITVDASNSITLQNVTLSNLHQDDFRHY